jgi:hypothetical protein
MFRMDKQKAMRKKQGNTILQCKQPADADKASCRRCSKNQRGTPCNPKIESDRFECRTFQQDTVEQ